MQNNNYRPKYEQSHALVVGINAYLHVNPLGGACADAESVAEILIDDLGFPRANVTVLLDGQATRSKVMERFLAYEFLSPDDRLVVFFAGHGSTVEGHRGPVGHLIPVDGRLDDKSTLIRWDDLTRNSEIIPAKHVLFIMDACYSGLAIQRGNKVGGERFVSDMLQRFSRQVITAGKADQPVSDVGSPSGKNSIFTGHLLAGLQGKAAAENGVLTATGLMHFVYEKVATDPQSQQTPHYGHLFGDGDFILRVPDNTHLSGDLREDFLVQLLPDRPEPVPSSAQPELKPMFAAKNGYADPEIESFGRNDWTAKLGKFAYRGGVKSEGVTATHWLALVAEPVSNQAIEVDFGGLTVSLRSQVAREEKPFHNFRFPAQPLTTSRSLMLYDADVSGESSGAEQWKRFLRIDQSGAIEYCETSAVASTRFAGRTQEHQGTPIKVFSYIQVIGLVWTFLFAVKRILRLAKYEAGVRILVNLVGAENSMLVGFSTAEGHEGRHWKDPFHVDPMMGGALQNWRCRDRHFQAEFRCALCSLGEPESQKLIINCAKKLGQAYNHQSSPRCFNYGTEIFPWNQFNPNAD